MPPDEEPDALSEAERRLLDLLQLLGGELGPAIVPERTARLLRRARFQRDLRPALAVSAGLAASVVAGLVPLLARRGAGGGA